MINKVTLIGRLGKEPETITIGDGIKKVSFSLATSENYKNQQGEWQEQTEWHNIVGWRNIADRMERVLSKGRLVYIEGRIRSRSWDDKEGNKRYITEIQVDYFTPLDKKPDGDERPEYGQSSKSGGYDRQEESNTQSTSSSQQEETEDDLPF